MILNTFLKKNSINLSPYHKSHLGINIARRFKTVFPELSLKKVKIKQKEQTIEVYDYPKSYFEHPGTIRIIQKFLKNDKTKKKLPIKQA